MQLRTFTSYCKVSGCCRSPTSTFYMAQVCFVLHLPKCINSPGAAFTDRSEWTLEMKLMYMHVV